ncbi:hypothetical protein ACYF6T_28945 [Streptomyces sp. 7R007]
MSAKVRHETVGRVTATSAARRAITALCAAARHVLDVEAGDPRGFSLAAGDGLHFVTRAETARNDSS